MLIMRQRAVKTCQSQQMARHHEATGHLLRSGAESVFGLVGGCSLALGVAVAAFDGCRAFLEQIFGGDI